MNKPSVIVEEQEEPARFSVEEFMGMADAGAFEDFAGKIELVEGVIVRMSPALSEHFWYQRQLFKKLDSVFGDGLNGWIVGQEPTVRIGKATVRDPDIAILRPPVVGKRTIFEAENVLLVAEVSDTSLGKDRGSKKSSYAKAMIPHYWIIDIKGRRVEVRSRPEDGKYQDDVFVAFGEPIAVPGTDESISID